MVYGGDKLRAVFSFGLYFIHLDCILFTSCSSPFGVGDTELSNEGVVDLTQRLDAKTRFFKSICSLTDRLLPIKDIRN
jgi:hypothetical protein